MRCAWPPHIPRGVLELIDRMIALNDVDVVVYLRGEKSASGNDVVTMQLVSKSFEIMVINPLDVGGKRWKEA